MANHVRALGKLGAMTALLLVGSVNCGRVEALHRFGDCAELETFLKEQYLHPTLEPQSGGGGVAFLFGCAARSASEDNSAGTAPQAEASSTEIGTEDKRVYTSTNTQEIGIDEADFVKNDGDYILVLRRGRLTILDAWPAENTRIMSDTLVDSGQGANWVGAAPFTMFFNGTRLFVASAAQGGLVSGSGTGPTARTTLALFDLTDKGAPRLLRRTTVEGSYLDARRVGDQIVVVTASSLRWPYVDRSVFADDGNRTALNALTLDDIFPVTEDQVMAVDVAPRRMPAATCEATYAPSETDGQTLVLVHTLNMADERAALGSTAVVTTWSRMYASEKSVYLAATEYFQSNLFMAAQARTRIHKFSAFQDGEAAKYVATGAVDGEILNQFSMDESGDDFRLVVTTARSEKRSTSLVVLAQEGDALVEVGRATGIGKDEYVHAVRFVGDRAYVVTYPEPQAFIGTPPMPPCNCWDPLYVVDLKDRKNPVVRGALEVEGYSMYIHPLDDNHLLTVGVITNTSNVMTGLSLALFDVTDPDKPVRTHQQKLGDGWSWSEALTNHHAFTYFAEEKALAIPVQLATGDLRSGFATVDSTGLEVYRVDTSTGFAHLGRLEQRPMFPSGQLSSVSVGCIDVRRSVMIGDENGSYVYAVSTGGVSVARLADGLPPVASLPFLTSGEDLCPGTGMPL